MFLSNLEQSEHTEDYIERMRDRNQSGDVQQGGRLMLKATLRSAVLLALVAFGMAMTSVPSFAEVQNVKVGGDVTVRAFHRENLDLRQEDSGAEFAGVAPTLDDEDDFIMQTTAVNIGADLTENVAANIRITNERDWDSTGSTTENRTDIDLSQAYITLKEIGR